MRLAEKAPDGTNCGKDDQLSVCFNGECQVRIIRLNKKQKIITAPIVTITI